MEAFLRLLATGAVRVDAAGRGQPAGRARGRGLRRDRGREAAARRPAHLRGKDACAARGGARHCRRRQGKGHAHRRPRRRGWLRAGSACAEPKLRRGSDGEDGGHPEREHRGRRRAAAWRGRDLHRLEGGRRDPEVDLLIVGTRHDTHAEIAAAGAASGQGGVRGEAARPHAGRDRRRLGGLQGKPPPGDRLQSALRPAGKALEGQVREASGPTQLIYRVSSPLPHDHWLNDPLRVAAGCSGRPATCSTSPTGCAARRSGCRRPGCRPPGISPPPRAQRHRRICERLGGDGSLLGRGRGLAAQGADRGAPRRPAGCSTTSHADQLPPGRRPDGDGRPSRTRATRSCSRACSAARARRRSSPGSGPPTPPRAWRWRRSKRSRRVRDRRGATCRRKLGPSLAVRGGRQSVERSARVGLPAVLAAGAFECRLPEPRSLSRVLEQLRDGSGRRSGIARGAEDPCFLVFQDLADLIEVAGDYRLG